jgi:hypothetical protein
MFGEVRVKGKKNQGKAKLNEANNLIEELLFKLPRRKERIGPIWLFFVVGNI